MAAKNHFQDSKRDIRRFEKTARRDRERDYRIVQAANDAAMQNLRKTQRGSTRRLTAQNERTMERINRLVNNIRAAGRKDLAAFEKKTADFGGMMAGRNAQDVRTLARGNRVTNLNTGAAQTQARGVGKTAQVMLDMAKETTRSLGNAADYESAQALGERAEVDATQAAEMRFQLSQMRLQHRLAIAEMEKQAELEKKSLLWQQRKAEQEVGSQTMGALRPHVTTAAQMIPFIVANNDKSPAEIADLLVSEGIINQEDAGTPVVKEMIRVLTTDTQEGVNDVDNLARETIEAFKSMPEWAALTKKQQEEMLKFIRGHISQTQLSSRIQALQDELDDDGGGIPSGGYRTAGKGGVPSHI